MEEEGLLQLYTFFLLSLSLPTTASMGPWAHGPMGPEFASSEMHFGPNAQGVFARCCEQLWSLKELLCRSFLKTHESWGGRGVLRTENPWTAILQVIK